MALVCLLWARLLQDRASDQTPCGGYCHAAGSPGRQKGGNSEAQPSLRDNSCEMMARAVSMPKHFWGFLTHRFLDLSISCAKCRARLRWGEVSFRYHPPVDQPMMMTCDGRGAPGPLSFPRWG